MSTNNITADNSAVPSLAAEGNDIRPRPLIGLTLSLFALTLAVTKLGASPLLDKDAGWTRTLLDDLSTTLADAREAINNSDLDESEVEFDFVLRPKAVFALAAALTGGEEPSIPESEEQLRELEVAASVFTAYLMSARQQGAPTAEEGVAALELMQEHIFFADLFGGLPADGASLAELLAQKLDASFRDDDSPSSDTIVQ